MRYLIAVLFISLLIINCSDSKGGSTAFSWPDSEGEMENLDYYMEFQISDTYDRNNVEELYVGSMGPVNSSQLFINGIEIPLDFFPEGDIFTYEANVDDNIYINSLASGDTINYQLSINNDQFTGSLVIIYEANINWPNNFNIDEDFTFIWNIEESPRSYLIQIFDELYEENFNFWEIEGSKREFTIQKENFENSSGIVEIMFCTVNYYCSPRALIYSGQWFYIDYGYQRESYNKLKSIKTEKRIQRFDLLRKVTK